MATPTTLERGVGLAPDEVASGARGDWRQAFNPRFRSAGALAARLGLGIILLAHGLQKLGLFGGAGWSGTLAFFQTHLGIPQSLGALAILTEAVGGSCLILGLFARPAALLAIVEMVVAAAKVHVANGFFLNMSFEPGRGHGFEMNLALVALGFVVLAEGAGKFALDTPLADALDGRAPGRGGNVRLPS